VKCGKALVNQLYARAQAQIDRGDVHENQGYELMYKLDNWFALYDRNLNYQQHCEVKEYFFERMKALDYKRQGINVPTKSVYSP
jgi:hypothetical protein